MKQRTGLDCIGHLGDVLFEKTGGPTPQMSDWSRKEKKSGSPTPAQAGPALTQVKQRKRSRLRLLLGVSTAE